LAEASSIENSSTLVVFPRSDIHGMIEFTPNISGRQEFREVISPKRGGIWLELPLEQHEKLREPS
jgi:hypothetical protein